MEDANEFAMEGPPTPLLYLLQLPAHRNTDQREREDEREMTKMDRGRTRGGLHAALLTTDSRV